MTGSSIKRPAKKRRLGVLFISKIATKLPVSELARIICLYFSQNFGSEKFRWAF